MFAENAKNFLHQFSKFYLKCPIKYVLIVTDLGSYWMIIGATYDNGDNTDSWCDSYQPLPKNIIMPLKSYGDCARAESSRLYMSDNAVSISGNANGVLVYFLCE